MYDARKLTKDEWRERREAKEARENANRPPTQTGRAKLESDERAWARGEE